MENFTPGQLLAIACGMLLAAAGFVNTVGSAMEKITKAWKAAKAPNEAQDTRLETLEAWRKEMEEANLPARVHGLEAWRTEARGMLANDKRQLAEIHDGMRVSHLAQLALLDHALNGNNVSQMQDAKDALQKYLTAK